jgi:hypothetical protein
MVMALSWPPKDPDELLDYRVDWARRLGTDKITHSVWPDAPPGIVIESAEYKPKNTTIWLSGGTEGETYVFVNRITTESGRIMDQSVTISIKSK